MTAWVIQNKRTGLYAPKGGGSKAFVRSIEDAHRYASRTDAEHDKDKGERVVEVGEDDATFKSEASAAWYALAPERRMRAAEAVRFLAFSSMASDREALGVAAKLLSSMAAQR